MAVLLLGLLLLNVCVSVAQAATPGADPNTMDVGSFSPGSTVPASATLGSEWESSSLQLGHVQTAQAQGPPITSRIVGGNGATAAAQCTPHCAAEIQPTPARPPTPQLFEVYRDTPVPRPPPALSPPPCTRYGARAHPEQHSPRIAKLL